MKRIFISALLLVAGLNHLGAQTLQTSDTLTYTRAQAETVFLKQNLKLIAEKLNIDQAEAQVIQAKLWPNPNLSVSEINLWKNSTAEQLPPISGNFGKTSEISVGLEQLIITAGKRKKMVAMEKVAVEKTKQYFEDFLRNLKIEFRNNLTKLQYTQAEQAVYSKQLASIQKLLNAYNNQLKQGNISKSEYIRLKASELEFLKEISDLQKDNNQVQKELKGLMNLPANSFIKISEEGFVPDLTKIEHLNIVTLTQEALKNRPDVKASVLEQEYSNNLYKYERAQRTPDVTLQASYDRGGNIMRDFVGFGFAMDLPFFSRNQGNIKSAKVSIEKSNIMAEQKNNEAQSEIMQSYQDLLITERLYKSVDSTYESDLDKLLESHLKNFAQRNISMLEYLDFVNAYLENKKIILGSKKELNEHFEELQFNVGKEL
ncbi:TolC family protein [Flavobacterium sp. '19STA2R22 D10 B1']|uniref:TolC family protein n=1 Tax=Flavobacterium aerium TaxID=3037261 RepID=UPI00278C59B4|nr:TolC family protein [Flavobacterium sp. '19STA2R22 D10 B1']